MTTTYCARADVVAIIGEPALLAYIDDDQDGEASPTENSFVTAAINRGATEMNESLACQYVLSGLSGNDWCKWCNAYLAIWFLEARRNNAPVGSVVDAVQTYRDKLREIRFGRFRVPEARPSYDHLPSVSNFNPELGNVQGPIAVDEQKSTTTAPVGNRKRNKAGYPFSYW